MSLAVVVLAAGQGTRMKSSLPKVLHPLYGKPLIRHVVDAVSPLGPDEIVVMVGRNSEGIRDSLAGCPVRFVVQEEQKGTGHALRIASESLEAFVAAHSNGTLLVLNGDAPLVRTATLRKFLDLHREREEGISILSFSVDHKHSYGRILRQGDQVSAIIEDRDCTEEQKLIREVNSGVYAMNPPVLSLLPEIRINESKGEYYLTDIVDIAVRKGLRVGAHAVGSEMELTGINTREELYRAGLYMRDLITDNWMDRGVNFMDKASVFIHPEVSIGPETVIYPNVVIEGETVIGRGCIIYPNTRIIDCSIGDGVVVKDSTVMESSVVKNNASVGPFAHIRPDSVIGSSCKIGNFVEIKKSLIADGTKASHLSYLGDAEVGQNVNIGAGTITCNYDGREKSKTIIGDDVFVGSDTQLVAPVQVGAGAYIGAGSTITKDVPPLSLSLSRAEQRTIENWAVRKARTKKSA